MRPAPSPRPRKPRPLPLAALPLTAVAALIPLSPRSAPAAAAPSWVPDAAAGTAEVAAGADCDAAAGAFVPGEPLRLDASCSGASAFASAAASGAGSSPVRFQLQAVGSPTAPARAAQSLALPLTVPETGRYRITFTVDATGSRPPAAARLALEIENARGGVTVLFAETSFEAAEQRLSAEVGLTSGFSYRLALEAHLAPDPGESEHFALSEIAFERLGGTQYFVNADGELGGANYFATIQQAIDFAADGDTVTLRGVADGVFAGPGNRDIRLYGKSILLRSDPSLPALIDAQASASNEASVFYVGGETTPNASVIRGISFAGGYQEQDVETLGGGVDVRWGLTNVLFEDCQLFGNTASGGGGLEVNFQGGQSAHATFLRCIIRDNVAIGSRGGGGVLIRNDSNVDFIACTFARNDATTASGGALSTDTTGDGVTVQLSRCLFFENSAVGGGAELWIRGGFTASLDTCMVEDTGEILGGWSGQGIYPGPPRLCDPDAGDYSHCAMSPALPPFTGGVQIGALGAGCGGCDEPILVSEGPEDAYPDLESALDVARPGDVIELADGQYDGPENRGIVTKPVTIRSASGNPEACVIFVESPATALKFEAFSDPTATFELSGITIQNAGRVDQRGGALDVNGVNGRILDCRFVENRASAGAVMEIREGAEVEVERCEMYDNEVFGLPSLGDGGGAIFINDATATFRECVIAGNVASQSSGGAAWVRAEDIGALATFERCTIGQNRAMAPGDAIYVRRENAMHTAAVVLDESIVWGDETQAFTARDIFVESGTSVSWSCSMLRPGRVGGSGDRTNGGVVPGPPRFCDPDGNDFRVAANSRANPGGNACTGNTVGAHDATCGDISVTHTVFPLGGPDYPTIQAAIDAAVDDDAVSLEDGSFTGAGNTALVVDGKTLEISSASGDSSRCEIDGQGSDTWGIVLDGASGQNASTLRGITLERFALDGSGQSYGAAIEVARGADVLVESCRISDCESVAGAIEVVEGASLVLRNSRLVRNRSTSASVGGAGVYVWGAGESSLTLENCIVAGNEPAIGSAIGGALYVGDDVASASQISVIASTIADNAANGDGAGLRNASTASLEVARSIVAGNGTSGTAEMDVAGGGSAVCSVIGTALPGGWSESDVLIADPLLCPSGNLSLCDESPVEAHAASCAGGERIGAFVNATCDVNCDVTCTPPDQPAAPSAIPICGGVRLTWDGSAAPEYNLFVNGKLEVTIPGNDSVTYDFFVASGDSTTRSFELQAVAADSCVSVESAAVVASPGFVPPPPPLVFSEPGCERVDVAWGRVAGADAYVLHLDGSPLATIPDADATSDTLTYEVLLDTPASLEIFAMRDSCESSATQLDLAPGQRPDAPTGLAHMPACRSVELSWDDQGAEAYAVYREFGSVLVEIARIDSTSYVDTLSVSAATYAVAAVEGSDCISDVSGTIVAQPDPPPAVTLIGPVGGTLVSQPVTVFWDLDDPAIDAVSVDVATSPDFAPASIVWTQTTSGTSVFVGRLLATERTYWWRVSAETDCDVFTFEESFTTAAELPVATRDALVDGSDVTLPIESTASAMTIFWRRGGDVADSLETSRPCSDDDDDGVFDCELPGQRSAAGVEYILELDFPDGTVSYGTRADPLRSSLDLTDEEAPDQVAVTYRMVTSPLDGVQGEDVIAELTDRFGAENENWKLRRWNDADGAYEELREDSPPDLSRGLAYWLVTRTSGDWAIDGTTRWPTAAGAAAVVDSFDVTLEPGWNMVGNPAGYRVSLAHAGLSVDGLSFAEAIDSSLVCSAIYLFESCDSTGAASEYVEADPVGGTLDAWSGCWIYNETAGDLSLTIPAREVSASDPCGGARESEDGWEATLVARSSGEQARVVLGVVRAGGRRDAALPPEWPGQSLRLALLGAGPACPTRRLYRDLAGPEETPVWQLEMESASTVELSWDVSGRVTRSPSAALVIEDGRGRRWDMRGTRSLRLGPGRRQLTIYGDGSVSAPPARDRLWLAARPNPFTAATALSVFVPEAGAVTVEVFDVTGRRAWEHRFLASEPGGRGVDWDGSRADGVALGAGVYFVRLRLDPMSGAPTQVVRRKITIVR